MNDVFDTGEKIKIIPANRLQKIKDEISDFKKDSELNNFQQWIVDELYSFDIPQTDFPVRSIILAAIPHPFYAEVVFTKNKKDCHCMSLVMSDFEKTEETLKKTFSSQKYNIIEAQNLPLKRLAVKSGLAVYGRNNICYIEGMGSNFSLTAYYSDIPDNDRYWTDIRMASACSKCRACLKNCPTGAIRENRFLVDTERCLSYWNESAEPFPAWMPASVHHCVYDCIKCQIVCPMNKDHIRNTAGPVRFTEPETDMLLSGLRYEEQPASLKQKVKYLGMHQWPDGISKTIKVLFELNDSAE